MGVCGAWADDARQIPALLIRRRLQGELLLRKQRGSGIRRRVQIHLASRQLCGECLRPVRQGRECLAMDRRLRAERLQERAGRWFCCNLQWGVPCDSRRFLDRRREGPPPLRRPPKLLLRLEYLLPRLPHCQDTHPLSGLEQPRCEHVRGNRGLVSRGQLRRLCEGRSVPAPGVGHHHGRFCPHWTPVVARTWEELVEEMRRASRL